MLTIRGENPGDIDAIRRVHAASFPTTLEARFVDELRAAGEATLSLVADLDGEIVGHMLFSPVVLDPPVAGTAGLGLAPMAVLPQFQSRGIGGDLVRNGLAAAAEAGFGFVVVIGAPGYYERFGFRKASAFRLGNEFGVDDPFMALELSAGALSDAAGIVRYRPEFNMFEE